MTEAETGGVILVLAEGYYPVIPYFEASFIELLSGSGKRRRRHRLFRWQRKLHAATVRPEILLYHSPGCFWRTQDGKLKKPAAGDLKTRLRCCHPGSM